MRKVVPSGEILTDLNKKRTRLVIKFKVATYTEVSKFQVVVTASHEEIRRFEICVDDSFFMNNFKCQAYLNEEFPYAVFS